MTTEPIYSDQEGDVIALSFATRLLLTDLDRDLIIERSIESLADFGRSGRVGLFLYDQLNDKLVCVGGMIDQVYTRRIFDIAGSESSALELMQAKEAVYRQLSYIDDLPWLEGNKAVSGKKCFCCPLIAANNQAIGLVTFEHDADYELPGITRQSLNVLLTVAAIALETARLFEMAVYDALTGLYIRRYFDLRLQEEENRVRRYGGRLAILMTDIDHFKRFNDEYGHQMGDDVLRETAHILQNSVRGNLDAVCRYGGEEFVVIMPDTDLAGATVVAERIRQRCQSHEIKGPDGPLQVTLSGGVACMDHDNCVSGHALLQRADDCLYQAKRNGRNQIQIQEP